MFIDEVKLKLIAGKGGDGCTSFRREKYLPMGGPDGGKGGKGASIIFLAEKGLKTLVDLKYHKIIKAPKGENGKGKNQTGKDAEDIYIKVPIGTTIYDEDTHTIIADLITDKQQAVIAKGGRGGKGNKAFATHDNVAPAFSELGEPGETRYIKCELRLLADVGLIGMPSVGKSSILSVITNSSPKIANYPFTTLTPNLGVVNLKDHKSFIIADLPGLIKGASKGVGLGITFLKHATRTKILAHVLDMSVEDENKPIKDYETIRQEIIFYSELLAQKEEIILANKMDMPNAKANLQKFQQKYPNKKIFAVSAVTKTGFTNVINYLQESLDNLAVKQEKEIVGGDETPVIYKFTNNKPFTITKENDVWLIKGQEVSKLFSMTRFDEEQAVKRFSQKLKKMGIEEELERLGAQKGDEIDINGYIFEWKD